MFGDMFDDVAQVQDVFTASAFDDVPLCNVESWKSDALLEACR